MKKKIEKYFQEVTGINPFDRTSAVNIGYSFAIDHPGFIKVFMESWTNYYDKLLDKVEKHSIKYADLLGQRGFTYEEFRFANYGSIPEEHYNRSAVYEILYIDDAVEKEKFKYKFDPDTSVMDQYIQSLKEWIKLECPKLEKLLLKKKIAINLPYTSFMRHTYFLSKSGSGKSELLKLITYEMMRSSSNNSNKSIVLIDPHGDLCLDIMKFSMNSKALQNRILYLDPNIKATVNGMFEEDLIKDDLSFTINPFNSVGLTKDDFAPMTEYLSEALFSLIDSSETFLMETIIESCVECIIRMESADFSDLKRFMDDEKNSDLLKFGASIPNPERAEFLSNKFRNDGRLASTKNSILMRVQKLIGNNIFKRSICGESTVDLESALNEGKIILVNCSKSLFGKNSSIAFGRLLMALISTYAFKRQRIPKVKRKDTFLIIDEFQNFVSPSIEDIMAETRKFKVFALLANQQVGQNMNSQVKRLISGNTTIKIAGENEPDSLEFMSSQMKHLTTKDFDKLPDYSFWVNDQKNKKAGSYIVRVPEDLVDTSSKYYMSNEQFKKFLLGIAYESGVYKKEHAHKQPVIDSSLQASEIIQNPFKE